MSRGVRWAETTRTSWSTPNSCSTSTAPCMTGRSDELPMTTATNCVEAVTAAPPPADRCRRAPASRGRGRPTTPGTAPPLLRPRRPSRAPVCVPAGRFLPYRCTCAPSTARPAARSRAGSAPSGPPKTLTLATWGCWGAVDPRGTSSTARTWFSNCDVTAPSIVQCPELWGRVATSLTRSRPPDQKSSTAMTPTPPAISATFWPRADAASSTSPSQPSRHEHLPADAAHLGGLDRRPGR